MSNIYQALSETDNIIWLVPLVMIIAIGVYFTIKLKFIQVSKFKESVKATFKKDKKNTSTYSSFHIFCVSMGNRIGVGNITGPIIAIMLGGAGAIFWMWVFAFIGAATSFVETTVGQIYKSRGKEGGFIGGPAYSIAKALKNKKLAITMATVMVLLYLGGFLSMEACTISESFCASFDFGGNHLVFALAITAITGLVIIGGFKRISEISVWLVPVMAIGWIVVCLITIAVNGNVIGAFGYIFKHALIPPDGVPDAFIGGSIGTMLIVSMKKGVLSNEAGVGTIPNISSMAETSHPARQGLSQMFGVIADIAVSTLTAIVVLSYCNQSEIASVYEINGNAMEIFQIVFEHTFGNIAAPLVSVFVAVFALTSIMGDYIIGKNNLVYITEKRNILIFTNVLVLILVFFSSLLAEDRVFTLVNILLAIAGIVNCSVMFMLCRSAFEAYRDYVKQRKEGINEPEFHKAALSNQTGVTEWD